MNILGLHLGHDASISLVRDGKLVSCYEIERSRRVKHALGIKSSELKQFLDEFNLEPTDIFSIAVLFSRH